YGADDVRAALRDDVGDPGDDPDEKRAAPDVQDPRHLSPPVWVHGASSDPAADVSSMINVSIRSSSRARTAKPAPTEAVSPSCARMLAGGDRRTRRQESRTDRYGPHKRP